MLLEITLIDRVNHLHARACLRNCRTRVFAVQHVSACVSNLVLVRFRSVVWIRANTELSEHVRWRPRLDLAALDHHTAQLKVAASAALVEHWLTNLPAAPTPPLPA